MPASPPPTPPRNARLAAAAVAVALLITLGVIGKRLLLDRAAPREVIERSDDGARDAGATTTDELPQPLPALTHPEAERTIERVVFDDGSEEDASLRPTGEVVGTVRRPRDGSVVTEGVVAFAFVTLTDSFDAAAVAAMDVEQRGFVQDYDEAAIAADGTFRCRLPAPAVVVRATVRPKVGSNREPQFLESERELGDLALAIDATLELQLVVDEGGSIEGVVVTAEGGFPIAGARVAIPWWSDSNDDWACESDLDGRFRVSGIRREVAAARSNSEAVVEAPDFVARRFLVPPAEDGLDVTGLRLAMERGVVVVVELLPPKGLSPDEREEWDEEIGQSRATLLPRAADRSAAIVALPWIVVTYGLEPFDAGWRLSFRTVPATREAVVVVALADGRRLATIAVDASAERAPVRRIVTPALAEPIRSETAPVDRSTTLTLQLVDPEGQAMARTAAYLLVAGGELGMGFQQRTDELGYISGVACPRGVDEVTVELRVAGYETVHLVETIAESAPTSPLPDPLVITLRPLTRAR